MGKSVLFKSSKKSIRAKSRSLVPRPSPSRTALSWGRTWICGPSTARTCGAKGTGGGVAAYLQAGLFESESRAGMGLFQVGKGQLVCLLLRNNKEGLRSEQLMTGLPWET